ncbi:hypothetical protein EJB05_17463, partial [Eragrostis curvula]
MAGRAHVRPRDASADWERLTGEGVDPDDPRPPRFLRPAAAPLPPSCSRSPQWCVPTPAPQLEPYFTGSNLPTRCLGASSLPPSLDRSRFAVLSSQPSHLLLLQPPPKPRGSREPGSGLARDATSSNTAAGRILARRFRCRSALSSVRQCEIRADVSWLIRLPI